MESTAQFESRKQDHIRFALDPKNQAAGLSGLDSIGLWHEALPDLDFTQISLKTSVLETQILTPFLISSMTAGHTESQELNRRLAFAAQSRGWLMGVGSQRRELNDPEASSEWRAVRKDCPRAHLLANVGLTQLIKTKTQSIQALVDNLEALALIVHTNPLQECLQPEGTPSFKGGLQALEKIARELKVPVVLKETGCGFSTQTLARLKNSGIAAVDISGFGGTHWGRIEGDRAATDKIRSQAADEFSHWGISTVDSLLLAVEQDLPFEIWGSGGVRSGLDAAKLLAMGASLVGFAQPLLKAALAGELEFVMERIEFELRCAMFCTGSESINDLRQKGLWRWLKT